MKKEFLKYLKESVFSIMPIFLIVMVLSLIFVPKCGVNLLAFTVGSVLLMFGVCLFSIGSSMSLMKMGGYIGSHLSKTKKTLLMIICAFFIGTIVTIAEPDLMVLANQVPSLNKWVFLITVSVGVGIFLVLSVIRILFKIKIKYILLVCYGLIAVLMFFVPQNFLPICFDASGVTTGPISVPFIMAFGLGIVAVRSGETAENDGFGLLAICSIGPILSVMIIAAIAGGINSAATTNVVTAAYGSASQWGAEFGSSLLESMRDVAIVLLPVVLFFIVYNFAALKYPATLLLRLAVGILYTYVGIVLFFTGVNSGYLPIAGLLSSSIMSGSCWWIVIPISFVLGLVIVIAEPAVHILNMQVEEFSTGIVKKRSMLISMSIGVSISVLLAALRAIFEINVLYIYLPIILLCIVLMFFVPQNMIAIAFDSGGVAAGSIAGSFILPFMQGICATRGVDVMTYGFGTIGLIVLAPIMVVEIMGLKISLNNRRFLEHSKRYDKKKVTVIEFD